MPTSPLHHLRCILGREKTRLFRKLNLIPTDWKASLPEETSFWAHALENPREHWNEGEFAARVNPDLPLQDDLKALLGFVTSDIVKIIDVGAGPLTRIGKKWDGKQIQITATDPLADEYDGILKKCGIVPLVRTVKFEGETLAEHFPRESFDLAYASNSLDHAYSPIDVIRQMILLLRPGGSIYLWHFANCGITERYKGLHQWNFCRRGNDMEISDGKTGALLADYLGPDVMIRCRDDSAFDSVIVVATITKNHSHITNEPLNDECRAR